MRERDKEAVEVKENPQRTSDFIRKHEGFILKNASKTAKRFISTFNPIPY